MCGRFSLSANADSIINHFSLTNNTILKPRYNIAPTQVVPIIRTPGILEFSTWGLKPIWLKEGQASFINARMETLSEKPAFKRAIKLQRCLVIADGYFEWKQIGNIKQPFYISLPQHELFAFAAVWDGDTCAVITKKADQSLLAKVHDRMPVIIAPDQYAVWLNIKTPADIVTNAMSQNNLPALKIYPVTTKVNIPKNDFSECIAPLN